MKNSQSRKKADHGERKVMGDGEDIKKTSRDEKKGHDYRFRFDPKEYQGIKSKYSYDPEKKLPEERFHGGLTKRGMLLFSLALIAAAFIALQGIKYQQLFFEPFYKFLFGYLPILMALSLLLTTTIVFLCGLSSSLDLNEKQLIYKDICNRLSCRWDKLHIVIKREGWFPHVLLADETKIVRVYRLMFPGYRRLMEYIYIARQRIGKPIY